jgi:hypothetical protein
LQDKEKRDAVTADVTKYATELTALAKSHLAVSGLKVSVGIFEPCVA